MFEKLIGSIISPEQKIEAISNTIKSTIINLCKENEIDRKRLFIGIIPNETDGFHFQLYIDAKPIRKIKMDEIIKKE